MVMRIKSSEIEKERKTNLKSSFECERQHFQKNFECSPARHMPSFLLKKDQRRRVYTHKCSWNRELVQKANKKYNMCYLMWTALKRERYIWYPKVYHTLNVYVNLQHISE